jgi:hypothetical protein
MSYSIRGRRDYSLSFADVFLKDRTEAQQEGTV